MKGQWFLIVGISFAAACSSHGLTNENHKSFKYAKLKSDYQITDLNHYGCEKIDASIIMHILQTGILITEKEVHDHYSTTGCSIEGSISINGCDTEFVFDYGGILYLGNGMIMGCAEKCCGKGYPYCSWDSDNLKGL